MNRIRIHCFNLSGRGKSQQNNDMHYVTFHQLLDYLESLLPQWLENCRERAK